MIKNKRSALSRLSKPTLMRIIETLALLATVGSICFEVVHASSNVAAGSSVAAANHRSVSSKLTLSSSQPSTTTASRNHRNETASKIKKQGIHDEATNGETAEKENSSQSPSTQFSFQKWFADRKNKQSAETVGSNGNGNFNSTRSATVISEPPTPPQSSSSSSSTTPRKVKSDRERGWPLWFPRNDVADEDATSSLNSTKSDTKNSASDHSEDSKPSRTLRQALTHHHHTDDHQHSNTSSTHHSAFPKEDDCKSVEELKIVLLDSPDHHHRHHHYEKDRHHGKHEMNNNSDTTAVLSESSGNITDSNSSASATNDDKEEDDGDAAGTLSPSSPQSKQQQQQLQQQQQQPNIIVLGSGAPFGMAMSGVGGEPPRRGQLNNRGVPVNPNQPPPNTMILAELMASVISTFIRLWFLTWITKRISMEEESIHPTQHFVWERLNDRYSRDAAALHTAISTPPLGVAKRKWQRHVRRTQGRHQYRPQVDLATTFSKTVLVVELSTTDKQGSLDLTHMTEVITFVLEQHRSHAFGTNATTITTTVTHDSGKEHTQQQVLLQPKPLEIVFLIESGGGGVGIYGLAAAQMKRLTQEPGITTTACVDLVAASGGYMIASQATQLIAAPFATLGSIGVMMEGLNYYDALQKYGVSPLIIKSGSSKNPLSAFGPVSRKDIEMEQGRLEKVHDAFRQLVLQGRPVMVDSSTTTSSSATASSTTVSIITPELEKVMDGSVFLGQEAVALSLVDAVKTSEEYILERIQAGDRVLKLHRSHRSRLGLSRRLSLLDLLPHLQSWRRGLIQSFGRWTSSLTSLVHDGSNSSMSTASLRFLQAATLMGLARHVIEHLQAHQHHSR